MAKRRWPTGHLVLYVEPLWRRVSKGGMSSSPMQSLPLIGHQARPHGSPPSKWSMDAILGLPWTSLHSPLRPSIVGRPRRELKRSRISILKFGKGLRRWTPKSCNKSTNTRREFNFSRRPCMDPHEERKVSKQAQVQDYANVRWTLWDFGASRSKCL